MKELIEKITDRLKEAKYYSEDGVHEVVGYGRAIGIIHEEAEAYKGEWKFDISGLGHYNCSVCGGRGDFYGKYNYCPHCGSKMNDAEQAKAYNESVKTNADYIRNMTDDELAEFINMVSRDTEDTISYGSKQYTEVWEDKKSTMDWLKAEREE